MIEPIEHLSDTDRVARYLRVADLDWAGGGTQPLLSGSAFNDRQQKPSVDLVRLNTDLEPPTGFDDSGGVIEFEVADVRGLKNSRLQVPPSISRYSFDVHHRPINACPATDANPPTEANPAHCQIEADRLYDSPEHFAKVKRLLAARVSASGRWVRGPNRI